ncbi:recombinase family protein [Gordonia alkaliphila]|uniref:Recombinase family protein n=1 Tax=Gordonia alkaliphila TaxID=1053547 RepID=A0ABP8Z555_9ACTN
MGIVDAIKPLVAREYLRVSQDADGRGKSLDQQQEENHPAITAQGWSIHPTPYRDQGISASRYTRKSRDGFELLITDLRGGSFEADILVLWESSRGSRRLGEWATLMDLCEDQGVQIWVTADRKLYDTANARDRKSLAEDAVDAEYESAKISKRIKRDVASAARAGRVHGKNLYGYQRHYVQGPRGPVLDAITEHPDQAPIVREAARRVLAGESLYAIAKDFNARGLPPRRPSHDPAGRRKGFGWTGGAVKQMLSIPAYAAKRVHRGEVVADAVWPALIEPDEWEALQAILFQPGRRRNANAWTVRYLCTGVVVCGVCGSRLRVGKQNRGAGPRVPKPESVTKIEYKQAEREREQWKQRRREECACAEGPDDDGVQGADRCVYHYRTYVCSGLPGPDGERGFHVTMKTEHLDRVISEMIIARLERPDFLAQINDNTDSASGERRELLAQINADRAYLEDVKAQAAEKRDLNIYFDQQARIQPQIDAAQARLEQLAAVDPLVLTLAQEGSVRTAWEAMDIVSQRRVIAAIAVPQLLPAERKGLRGLSPERITPGWK